MKSGLHYILVFILTVLAFCGCASYSQNPRTQRNALYRVGGEKDSLARKLAPVFYAYGVEDEYNRIGKPVIRIDESGNENTAIDVENPVVYYTTRRFTTAKETYTNVIYRIHFPAVPVSLIPFHLTAGKNVGLIVVITLDAARQPVLITTVNTCGCYLAITATSHLPVEAYPDGFNTDALSVYGETLPAVLDFENIDHQKLVVHLRPDTHRVMNLSIVESSLIESQFNDEWIVASFASTGELKSIPVNGKTTSLFFSSWPLKGHVKGAIKPWESMLLSLISLDLFVGADKVYDAPVDYGNPFYTSLKPWNRRASDMRDFKRFLEFWGWKL